MGSAERFLLNVQKELLTTDKLVGDLGVLAAHLNWSALVHALVDADNFGAAQEIGNPCRETSWVYECCVDKPREQIAVLMSVIVGAADQLLDDIHREVVDSVANQSCSCMYLLLQVESGQGWYCLRQCYVVFSVVDDSVNDAP